MMISLDLTKQLEIRIAGDRPDYYEIINYMTIEQRNYLLFCFCTVLETDRPDPNLSHADIKYVPEQM